MPKQKWKPGCFLICIPLAFSFFNPFNRGNHSVVSNLGDSDVRTTLCPDIITGYDNVNTGHFISLFNVQLPYLPAFNARANELEKNPKQIKVFFLMGRKQSTGRLFGGLGIKTEQRIAK